MTILALSLMNSEQTIVSARMIFKFIGAGIMGCFVAYSALTSTDEYFTFATSNLRISESQIPVMTLALLDNRIIYNSSSHSTVMHCSVHLKMSGMKS